LRLIENLQRPTPLESRLLQKLAFERVAQIAHDHAGNQEEGDMLTLPPSIFLVGIRKADGEIFA